jgi:antitoxin component YwqK of YwqJK toxin-antitoxin module
MCNRKIVFAGLLIFSFHLSIAQLLQTTKVNFTGTAIVDSAMGIMAFEKYNKFIGGDSIRKINGKNCNTWVEDYYPSGKIIHRGFYVEGQLQSYKNFFENGNKERSFKIVSDYKCNLKLYHANGNLRTDIDYNEGFEYKTVEYYPNGNMEYLEELDKGKNFFLKKENYYQSGQLAKRTELDNRKKKLYTYKEYYENNVVKEEGFLIFSPNLSDYVKDGMWKFYNEQGKMTLEQYYIFGEMNKETKH